MNPSIDTRHRHQSIDGLRALAAGMVVFQHWFPPSLHFDIEFGYWGVLLFFVISGFLITNIILDNGSKPGFYKNFYARRVLRIFPPYYALVFCLYFLNEIDGEYLLICLAYVVNIFFFINQEWPKDGSSVFWTLSIEEQFYMFWPFILLTFTALSRFVPITLTLVAIILLRILFSVAFPEIGLTRALPVLGADGLMAGCTLAVLLKNHEAWFRRWVPFAILPALLFLAGITVLKGHLAVFAWQYLLLNTSAMLLFCTLIGMAYLGSFRFIEIIFGNRIAVFAGTLSYGIYLYHMFSRDILIFLLDTLGLDENLRFGVIGYVLLASVCFTISFASWVLLENPILKLKKHFRY